MAAYHDPADRPAWVDEIDNPYLHGIYTPTIHETTAHDLEVLEGEIPAGLYGAYLRNGPNPVHAPKNQYHWFDGDGMVHGVYFRDGRASYRNRLVRTTGLAAEERAGRGLLPGMIGPYDLATPAPYIKDTANTDIIFHNGKLLATWYVAGEVYRLDPLTLDDRGRETWEGALQTNVSAHPKVDPRTGEFLYFSYGDQAPYMRYGVVSPDGKLSHEIPVELPGPRLPHDLTFTENYTILHDFPLFHHVDELHKTGHRILRFHRELPSRFAVLPRHGQPEDIRWFEFEPGYVLHMVNAWEEDDWIVMDGCFQPDPTGTRRPEDGVLAAMLGYFRMRAYLKRWRMNTKTGECREEALDDLNVEFPLPDINLYGQRSRYSYALHMPMPDEMHTLEFHALDRYDHRDGSHQRFDYGPGISGNESPFAPAPDRQSEDEGWVLSLVSDKQSFESQCWIFDARDIPRGPVARLRMPARVPAGFHAQWVSGDSIWTST